MKFEKLGNIVNLRNGYAFKSEMFEEEGVPIIRISDINGNFVSSQKAVRIKFNSIFMNFKIQTGDLLIAMSGATTGKYGIYNSEEIGYQNQRVGCFVIKDKNKLDKSYLFQVLGFIKPIIEKKAHGSGQPNISGRDIEELEIPLPPLPDQLHIANLLSKAENLIAQRKESIRLLDEFLKSTFWEMFGKFENDTPLQSFCAFTQGIQVPVEEQYFECKPNQVRFLRIIDFTQTDEPRYIDNLGERYFIKEDDICMVRYGASAGFVGFGKRGIIANNLFKFNFDKLKVLPIYLFSVLQSERFKKYIQLKSTGSAMPALSFGMLNAYQIAIPPITLQTQFAQIVEKTEDIKTQYQQSLQELENLYGSLSQKAFKGELTIKENS